MARKPKPQPTDLDALKLEVARLAKTVRSQGRAINRLTIVLEDVCETSDQGIESFKLLTDRFVELVAASNLNHETADKLVDAFNDAHDRVERIEASITSATIVIGAVLRAAGHGRMLDAAVRLDHERQIAPEEVEGAVVIKRRLPVQA